MALIIGTLCYMYYYHLTLLARGVAAQWAGRALAPPIFLKTAAILLKLVNNY